MATKMKGGTGRDRVQHGISDTYQFGASPSTQGGSAPHQGGAFGGGSSGGGLKMRKGGGQFMPEKTASVPARKAPK